MRAYPATGVYAAPVFSLPREVAESRWVGLAAIWLAHGLLALAMHRSVAAATLHAVATLAGGFAVALASRHAYQVLCAGAYIVGAEVLWRMSGAVMFHEVAKYGLALVFVAALLRMERPRLPGRILLFLALLMPAVVITYFSTSLGVFRKAVSFNLSGALALAAAVCFCVNARVAAEELWRVFLTLMGPVAGVAAITLFSTYATEGIRFTTDSNFETSGGFGPNQVASALGLAALLALLYLVQARTGAFRRVLLVAALVVFAMQSTMTFSRGGVYVALGAFLAATPFLVREGAKRRRLIALAALTVAGAFLVIGPALNAFTGGKLAARYRETHLTQREGYFLQDLKLWAEHPVYGTGVGISSYYRRAAAHTEFSRMLAEHGLFGLAALGALLSLTWKRLTTMRGSVEKALAVSLITWTFLYMTVNAFRLGAPALAFGLAFLTIRPHDFGEAFRRE